MFDKLLDRFRGRIKSHELPDGSSYQSVALSDLQRMVGPSAKDLKMLMIQCLENGLWPACFRSNRGMFSAEEQIKLLQSGAAIIGAGGLGGMVVQGLARVGVGRLNVCDGDRFEESNLNRQLLSRLKTLGKNKAQCAKEEVKAINPAIEVGVFDQWATPANLFEILTGCQIAVDCLDSLSPRYHLQSASERVGIPFVHGSVGAMEGFLMTVSPGERGFGNLYGPEPLKESKSSAPLLGVPSFTPGVVGSLQVCQTVMILLGRQGVGGGKVFHIDLSIPSIELLYLPEG